MPQPKQVGAYTNYIFKRCLFVNDIGTEELAHLEMVGTMFRQLIDGVPPAELDKHGLGGYC